MQTTPELTAYDPLTNTERGSRIRRCAVFGVVGNLLVSWLVDGITPAKRK